MRTRRDVLAALGTAGVAGLAGCGGLLGGGDGGGPGTGGPGGEAVAGAAAPADTAGLTYAQTGTAGPVVEYYGNWKCPVCAEFSNGSDRVLDLGRIIRDFVEPGDLTLRFRGLAYTPDGEPFLGPDAPRAARAGLAVWNEAPERYWPFHERVFAEQPAESETWATVDRLVSFADAAGVEATDAVRTALEDGTYAEPVQATADRAQALGVTGTPSLVIDGAVYNPFNPGETLDALEALVG